MEGKVKLMTVIEYFEDGRPWKTHNIKNPDWKQVEMAIRKMDDRFFPNVMLSCKDLSPTDSCFDDEDAFTIMGGNGKIALFHQFGDWQYVNSNGKENEVILWESDQGYFCKEKNIIYDIELVLRITKHYFQTGSYHNLDNIH